MLRGVLVAQLLQAATTQSRVRPSACFRRAGFVIASFPSRSRSPSPFRVSSVRFVSQPNPAVFPACGRNSTARASSTEHEMSLPKGEGADALVAQSCADLGACSRETPLLTPTQITTNMRAVPVWVLSADGKSISRNFTAKNWQCAFAFLNHLSEIAEHEGHHPDMHLTNYRDVRVVVTTHAIGGLSLHDFVLAAKLDKVDVTYSPKWLREHAAAE